MTILACLFYVTIGIFLGFMCWLIADIKEAVESKIKKTAATKTATTKTKTVATNREYYVHGGIVYDPNGNPI